MEPKQLAFNIRPVLATRKKLIGSELTTYQPDPIYVRADNGDITAIDALITEVTPGVPETLIGFSNELATETVDLPFHQWTQDTSKAIGMYPIFAFDNGDIATLGSLVSD